MAKKVLVIGGGMAGCCAAHMLSDIGLDITLVEAAPFLGGGCKTFTYGGHPYTYGPRHFLTTEEKLFNFLNQYVPMRRIEGEHGNLTYVEKDKQFYNYPVHADDIPKMPDSEQVYKELENIKDVSNVGSFAEYVTGSLGASIFEKFFNTYSKKMWQIESTDELDSKEWAWREIQPKGIELKTGSKAAWEDRISAFPLAMNGYDDYFDIATANTKVHLSTKIEEYDIDNYKVKIQGEWHTFDIIISSTLPEVLMNNRFGPLRWMGRDFFKIVLPMEHAFPPGVNFLYYANEEPFTRIVEYKRFYKYEAPTTLIGLEIPSKNNKLYPYPTEKDEAHAQQYLDELPENVFSIGRAGSYRYYDIDNIIAQCFDLVEKLG